MKKVLILVVMSLFTIGTFAQTQWQVDPNHSSLNFSIKHSGISLVNGKFLHYTGSLTTNGDALSNAQFNFNVQVASINTNVDARDKHLRSADFFEVETYPTMTFKSTKILATGKPEHFYCMASLLLKGLQNQ